MSRKLLVSLVAVLLGACQSPYFDEGAKLGQRVNDPAAPDATIHYDQVVILDRFLQSDDRGRIAVESQGARRTETGTVRVFAQFRNRTDKELKVQARVSFFDGGYAPIDEPSAWQFVSMPPNGIGKYEGSSLGTAEVAHYLIEVRGAR